MSTNLQKMENWHNRQSKSKQAAVMSPINPRAMNWRSKRDRMAVTFVSHGHWRIDIYSDYPRRIIKSCITTDSQSVDDFKAEEWEKYGRYNVRKMGTETLWNEVQSKSRTNKQTPQ